MPRYKAGYFGLCGDFCNFDSSILTFNCLLYACEKQKTAQVILFVRDISILSFRGFCSNAFDQVVFTSL